MNPPSRCVPAITRLQLQNFRSYDAADLRFDGRIVVLTGPNGAGKTNLLEALSFLAPGRGLRRAALGEVQRVNGAAAAGASARDSGAIAEVHQDPPWAVAATVDTGTGPVMVGTGLEREDGVERRALRIDGAPRRGQSALSELLTVAWLTPAMDRLFVEGASGRRRFLDRLVQGRDPHHAGRLGAYEHAMRERARLLREGRADARWLDALEDTMARHAVATAAARRALCDQLAHAVALGVGPFPAADVTLDGELEQALDRQPALALEETFRGVLAAQRALDAETGTTTRGVHRTDLKVRHRAKAAPAERCSTGEQKALLVALQLAYARLLHATTGVPPVLLLDEIAAHLDEVRRTALFDELRALSGQAWLTGTDPVLFRPLGAAAEWLSVAESALFQGEIP
ncbi:MAG TPA: DNA replication/repair protein RecF [Candidatus Sulfotelmatobacter sp.]|nr:DNA replication/repair protein RecF [Candidatus Sulfotelmatobacter sp.]